MYFQVRICALIRTVNIVETKFSKPEKVNKKPIIPTGTDHRTVTGGTALQDLRGRGRREEGGPQKRTKFKLALKFSSFNVSSPQFISNLFSLNPLLLTHPPLRPNNVRSAAGKPQSAAHFIVFLFAPFLQPEAEISGPSLHQVSSFLLYSLFSLKFASLIISRLPPPQFLSSLQSTWNRNHWA